MSRTCRSTAAGSCCLVPRPSWSTRPPRRSSGRSCPAATGRSSSARATKAGSSRVDAQGHGHVVLRRRRARGARARAGAGRRPLRRAPRLTGRSTRSIAAASRRPSSSLANATSGRWPRMPKGFLYAATGEKGVVYRISPDGKGARFYQARATHVTALAFDRSRQSPDRNRVAGPGASRRSRGQGVRAARLPFPGNPHASLRRQGDAVRGRRERRRGRHRPRRPAPTTVRRNGRRSHRARL